VFAPLRHGVQAALAIAVPHALVALKAHRSAQNALEVGLAFLESMSAVESHRVSASVEAWRSRSPCRLQYWIHATREVRSCAPCPLAVRAHHDGLSAATCAFALLRVAAYRTPVFLPLLAFQRLLAVRWSTPRSAWCTAVVRAIKHRQQVLAGQW
jgi:hypothetical protein